MTKSKPLDRLATQVQDRARAAPRLRILLREAIALGPGKAELLERIPEIGSISAAARRMGMSYRRAWVLVETMNQGFRRPLVETAKGGAGGGGARVSDLGSEVLARYRRMEEAAAEELGALVELLADSPPEVPRCLPSAARRRSTGLARTLVAGTWRLILPLLLARPVLAADLTIAAAADLKFAMAEVVEHFRADHPDDKVEVIYGSSGKFFAQIANGAPFDLYLSADSAYPRQLEEKGLTASETRPYALGRIVLWSLKAELAEVPLKGLPGAPVRKLAIANPDHAPYGLRAKEALEHQGVWEALKPRLVLGENIAHTAQFVDSGAADAGILALALVRSPTLAGKGAWTLIPAEWHEPLEQGYVILKRAADNPLAHTFADYMASEPARVVMRRYGFILPGEGGP